MKKVLVVMAVLMMVASAASATQIAFISATSLVSVFTAATGDLSINDTADVVVEDIANAQTTYAGNAFMLSSTLSADSSAGGIAMGTFTGGSISVGSLLSADIVSLDLGELPFNNGVLAGTGTFQVTGGSLAADFGSIGDIVQIMFTVDPVGLDDFSADFDAMSNITLSPIPEPATMLMLGLGGLVALKRRK